MASQRTLWVVCKEFMHYAATEFVTVRISKTVHHDAHASARGFKLNDLVFVRNFSPTQPTNISLSRHIVVVHGLRSYLVQLIDN